MHHHITLLVPNQTTSLFFFFSVSPVKPLKLTLLNRRALVGHSTLGTRKPLSGSPRNRLPVAGEPAQALAMAGTVVVFDFDRTIIDGDSDSWVINEMGVSELFSELRSTMPWNSLMDKMITEIQSRGKTVLDIANCLQSAFIHPSVVSAIKSAHELGCELRIISDANKFFIEVILEHHGVLGCFTEIATNPTYIEENGRLRILPYHDLSSPHGCNLCPPNMCKGLVIDQLLQDSNSETGRRRIIYLGDGGGDFCPTLRLATGDHVMPRKDYPLWKRICKNRAHIKASVHEWSNGDELCKILLHLINTTSDEDISLDNSSSEAHPKANGINLGHCESRDL